MGSCFPFLSKEDNVHQLAPLIHMDFHTHEHTEEDLLTDALREKNSHT